MTTSAEVTFDRKGAQVKMRLSVDGKVVAKSASQESIANELQIRAIRSLTIENTFFTELPTSQDTLELAGKVQFSEPMAALKLLAACSSIGETTSFPYPERRAKPKIDIRPPDDAQFTPKQIPLS